MIHNLLIEPKIVDKKKKNKKKQSIKRPEASHLVTCKNIELELKEYFYWEKKHTQACAFTHILDCYHSNIHQSS